MTVGQRNRVEWEIMKSKKSKKTRNIAQELNEKAMAATSDHMNYRYKKLPNIALAAYYEASYEGYKYDFYDDCDYRKDNFSKDDGYEDYQYYEDE